MLNIEIRKLQYNGVRCDNPNCKHSPETHYVLLNNYYIRKYAVCAFLYMGTETDIYCPNCIDEIYQLCKSKLNKTLWPFQ